MAACTTYSNRMVVNTSCRIRSRSRTLPSTQRSTFSKTKSKLTCHQSFRSIPTRSHVTSTSNMMYQNSQKSFTTLVSNTQDQERTNFHVLLSSTVLAFAFGIFSASTTTTTQRHHDPLSSVGSGSNSNYYNNLKQQQAGNGRRGSGGGGGGSGKKYSKVLASVVSQKDAEQDIRQVEIESVQNPYEVRKKEEEEKRRAFDPRKYFLKKCSKRTTNLHSFFLFCV